MRALAVTIGVGPDWLPVATWVAERVHRMHGLDVLVIEHSALVHAGWEKCRIFELVPTDTDVVLYFDADVVPIRPLDTDMLLWQAVREGKAIGVADQGKANVRQECARFGLERGLYLNTGWLILPRAVRPAVAAALAWHPNGGTWGEQTALVAELQKARQILTVATVYNTMGAFSTKTPPTLGAFEQAVSEGAANWHPTGSGAAGMRALQQALLPNVKGEPTAVSTQPKKEAS